MGLQDRDYMRVRPVAGGRRTWEKPSRSGLFARLGFWLWNLWRALKRGIGLGLFAGVCCWDPEEVRAAIPVDHIPLFQWRGRVVSTGGVEMAVEATAAFSLMRVGAISTGTAWSAWRSFEREQAVASVGPHSYPNSYMKGFPLVLQVYVDRIPFPAEVEVELVFEEKPDLSFRVAGRLGGRRLGLLVWRENDGPRAASMGEWNRRRYWETFESAAVAPEERPKLFPIADRFIPGDDDLDGLEEGVLTLVKGGFNTLLLDPNPRNRALLERTGLSRITWAVYNPPGYAFDYGGIAMDALDQFARSIAIQYQGAGFMPEQMALFTISDEPGWYYPAMFRALTNSPAGMERFRLYLRDQGLSPREVGARRWEEVKPLGRGEVRDLASRRLFYWTMRFFAWDSARHFADCTRAMERAFYPNLPVIVNWNFFTGRLYVPGPVANNSDRNDPDAAMGGHDWLEFGRLRGCTMLWTEDWFSDRQAPQWSWYAARLREGARQGGVTFGGYIIPRTAGDRAEGILQKILTLAGCGGKAVKYFVFGPEYNFPGNCYSENVRVIPAMAEAHRLLGRSEGLLWPGRMLRSPVGLLWPRSAQMWDATEERIPKSIQDATNTDLNRQTVDYWAELFNLYQALQHANIPADVVDEDDLTDEGLRGFKVLYVTAPNIPEEGQRALVRWVERGGVLAMVCGAGQLDRYNEPSRILSRGLGYSEKAPSRLVVSHVRQLPESGAGGGLWGGFTAHGPRSELVAPRGEVLAAFDDGSPAVIRWKVKRGSCVRFSWFPGLSYAARQRGTAPDGLPGGWDPVLRAMIVDPVRAAGVVPPVRVDREFVETPMLVSEKGIAVTLLNWWGAPLEVLKVEIDAGYRPARIESARLGSLSFEMAEGGTIRVELPLGAADILSVWRP